MKIPLCILLSCGGSWSLTILLVPDHAAEIFLGMLAPMLMALANVVVVERVFTRDPSRLTGVMATAFLAKMVLCALYMVVVLGLLAFQPVPFAVSFCGYFILLHSGETVYLRGLFNTRSAE